MIHSKPKNFFEFLFGALLKSALDTTKSPLAMLAYFIITLALTLFNLLSGRDSLAGYIIILFMLLLNAFFVAVALIWAVFRAKLKEAVENKEKRLDIFLIILAFLAFIFAIPVSLASNTFNVLTILFNPQTTKDVSAIIEISINSVVFWIFIIIVLSYLMERRKI